MTKLRLTFTLVAAACIGACTANIHDNTVNIPDATVQFNTDVDVQNVMPGQTVPVTVEVHNVTLVDPMATPPAGHDIDAGHLVFTLDDEDNPPVLVTAETMVNVPIPPDTKPGKHKVICRVHKHDNTPTETKFEIEINVKASITTDGDGGVSVDASVSIEAGVTTTTPAPAPATY